MSTVEMERVIDSLQQQIMLRDRLLRMAYYAVRQLRGPKEDRLRAEMAPWAPMPQSRPL